MEDAEETVGMDARVSPEDAVVEFLNSELPTLDDLSRKGLTLLKEVREKNEALRKSMSLENNSVYVEGRRVADEMDALIREEDALQQRFEACRPDVERIAVEVRPLLQQINAREQRIAQLETMEWLELLSSSVQASLVIGAFDRTLATFAELSQAAEPLIKAGEAEVGEYARDKVLHWYGLLKDKVAGDFEEAMKALNWPFVSSSSPKPSAAGDGDEKDVLAEFRLHFLQLLQLRLPDSLSDTSCHPEGPLFRDWRPVSPPVQVMIRPLRKRFYYHFYGARKTNNLEKPEWYISQAMSWIKDHGPFLSNVVQPYVDTLEGAQIDVKMEFIRGIVALVLEKLWRDLPEVVAEEEGSHFPHYVDEMLGMEVELRQELGYPSHLPSPVDLLTQDQHFRKWMSVERSLAAAQLDEMLTTGAGDSMLAPLSANFRRPACADGLLALLQSMTGRARGLRSLTRRAQFLRLQLDLLDDFRLRLRQMSKRMSPGDRQWAALLNGLFAVRETLADWADDMFYVELWEDASARHLVEELSQSLVGEEENGEAEEGTARSRVDSIKQMLTKPLLIHRADSMTPMENNSVFDATIRLYSHLLQEMLRKTIDYVYTDVRARSLPYRRNNWLVLPTLKKESNIGLSPTACEMFLLLRDWLHEVSSWLEESLFQKVWQSLAKMTNDLVYKQVILTNRFNTGGASQIKFDISRNLVPLFAVYTPRPEHYFRESLEAIALLCLASGSAMLLKQVLHSALHAGGSQDPLAALQDVGVFRLAPDEAELVMSLRVESDA